MSRILGLDITSDAVRGVVVRLAMRRVEVERFAEVPLRAEEDPEEQRLALEEALRSLLIDLDRVVDGSVGCLPGEDASLRRIDLPAGAAKRLKQVLPFELEALLPFDLDESIVDYQAIRRTPQTLSLLATAIPKERIAARLEELQATGLEAIELAVGAAALDGLLHVVTELSEPGPHVLLHIDRDTTDLVIIEERAVTLARTLSVGAAALERGEFAGLDSDVRRTIAGYRAQGGASPARVFLSGLAPEIEGVAALIETSIAVTPETLPMPTPPIAPPEWAPRFARALGLASRLAGKEKRLNLRQDEFAASRTVGGLQKHARLIAICALAVVASMLFSVLARRHVLSSEHEALVARLESTTKALFDREAHTAAEARAMLARPARAADPLPRFDAFDALDVVSKAIPSSITHSARRMLIEVDDQANDGRLEIEGQVPSVADRDVIAKNLEANPCFKNIERGPTRPGSGNQGTIYRLEATIQCPGTGPAAAEGAAARRGQ